MNIKLLLYKKHKVYIKTTYFVLALFLFSSIISLSQSLRGNQFQGKEEKDFHGEGMDLSYDGSIIAIGSKGYDVDGAMLYPDRGLVRVYKWGGFSWDKIGGDLIGIQDGSYFGKEISISDNGLTVAVGMPNYDIGYETSAEQNHGAIQVYEYDGISWTEKGSLIIGQVKNEYLGYSFSLSSDGSFLVIGAPNRSGTNDGGVVNVYEFDDQSLEYVHKGETISVPEASKNFGANTAISNDGNRIVVSSSLISDNNTGLFRNGAAWIFEYNSNSNKWVQLGNTIRGDDHYDYLGYSVDMTANGNRIVVSMPQTIYATYLKGIVRVYDYVNDGSGTFTWKLVGSEIEGFEFGERFGESVSISSNGGRIIAGAPTNSERGRDVGSSRMFEFNVNSNQWLQLGSDIDGEGISSFMGDNVSISGDGNVVATSEVAYKRDTGRVSVYECLSQNASVNYKNGTGNAVREEISDGIWTDYYDSDNNWLLSIKKNEQDIGNVNDGEFAVTVETNNTYGDSKAVDLSYSMYAPNNAWFVINKKWNVNVAPGKQPSSPVGIKFPFATKDYKDLYASTNDVKYINNMILYKVKSDQDPYSKDIKKDDIQFLLNGTKPSTDTWVYRNVCGRIQVAEFEVDSFSGGSAGYGPEFVKFLPVELTSFTVSKNDLDASLIWATATELNNNYFDIEMSINGVDFYVVGRVNGNGTTKSLSNYQFTHPKIGNSFSKVYYRLKQVDYSGDFEYSNIVELQFEDLLKQKEVFIHPNPIIGNEVTIINAQNSEAFIYNATGQLVFQEKLTSSIENKLNVSQLAKGFYIIQLVNENKKSQSLKMIK